MKILSGHSSVLKEYSHTNWQTCAVVDFATNGKTGFGCLIGEVTVTGRLGKWFVVIPNVDTTLTCTFSDLCRL